MHFETIKSCYGFIGVKKFEFGGLHMLISTQDSKCTLDKYFDQKCPVSDDD